MSFNKVVLVGRLTRDPNLKQLDSGRSVCDFSVALNHKFGETEKVVYVDVTTWGKTADNCGKYLSKGREVLVEGRLEQDNWEDKNSGAKRSKLFVVGEVVQFIGSGNGASQREEVSTDDIVSDVPF